MVQKNGLFLKEKRKNYQGQKFTYSFELELLVL